MSVARRGGRSLQSAAMPPEASDPGARQLALALGATAATTTVLVLLSWALGGAAARSVAEHMRPNSAFCFALCGTALMLRAGSGRRWLGDALCVIAVATAGATLGEYTCH